MNKPSWDNAPEWANYLAMDYRGDWHWFEYFPAREHQQMWYTYEGRHMKALSPEPRKIR